MRSEAWRCAAQIKKRREFLKQNARACFLIALNSELGAGKPAPRDNNAIVKRNSPHDTHAKHMHQPSFSISSSVSWEELTSSRLRAQSYGEAGKYVLIPYPQKKKSHPAHARWLFLITWKALPRCRSLHTPRRRPQHRLRHLRSLRSEHRPSRRCRRLLRCRCQCRLPRQRRR